VAEDDDDLPSRATAEEEALIARELELARQFVRRVVEGIWQQAITDADVDRAARRVLEVMEG
jgi:hypothetical protein